MSRNKICKSTIVAVMVAGALMLTACGGASVPDKYNYDDFSKTNLRNGRLTGFVNQITR